MKQRQTILIVDDDFAMRHILKNIMSQMGDFDYLEAEDGVQALEEVQRNKPDLVFLDILMPGMSGVEALENMKNLDLLDDTVVIMCTAERNIKTVLKALEYGAKDYIVKPFSLGTVLDKAKKWLLTDR